MLEDWASLSACWEAFKAGPKGNEIDGNIGALRAFFQGSLVFPEVHILVLLEGDVVRGFSILTETSATMPTADGNSIIIVRHGFVRGIHIQHGVPLAQSLLMAKHIDAWGISRGYPFLTGHCSPEYLSKAEIPYTRLGWKKTHTVVVKKL